VSDDIVIALITAGVPSAFTAITTFFQNRLSKKHAARNSILQLIMEDHMAVQEGKLPTNYKSVLYEYDIYKKNGGNSYIESKISEYKIWFDDIQKRMKK
jgi:archaellum component FlaG (FlaF/FlaG flagellin family)